jgi:hypothetical protein
VARACKLLAFFPQLETPEAAGGPPRGALPGVELEACPSVGDAGLSAREGKIRVFSDYLVVGCLVT